MTPELLIGRTELLVAAGGLAGGFVNGLTGFGTGLTALSFWLLVLPPVVASPLVVVCSLIGQVQTLPRIYKHIVWSRVRPFIIGGLFGAPIGAWLLPMIPVPAFKIMVGTLLIGYCAFMLATRRTFHVTWGGKWADGGIGFGGGVMGGIAGLSGPLPTIWATLRGWPKDERRGVFQAYNISAITVALAMQALHGFITWELGYMVLIALPGTLIGVWIGRKVYDRLGPSGFDRVVLLVLILAGITTILAALNGS